VISLPIASAQSRQLRYWSFAGDGTPYPIACLKPHIGPLSAFLRRALALPRTPITPKSRLIQPLSLICATAGASKSP
jgi:hypothetical protein